MSEVPLYLKPKPILPLATHGPSRVVPGYGFREMGTFLEPLCVHFLQKNDKIDKNELLIEIRRARRFGDTTLCRMIGVTLHTVTSIIRGYKPRARADLCSPQ